MRYVAAYLLCNLSGNENVTVEDIENVLGSVGVGCDKWKANFVIEKLKGKNIEEVIEGGKDLLASTVALANEFATPSPQSAQDKPEETKEPAAEEKKEETEESDDDLGFGLFD